MCVVKRIAEIEVGYDYGIEFVRSMKRLSGKPVAVEVEPFEAAATFVDWKLWM
tara:strand:+ start:581 stop:739 length:159 start_codon:yes stop_codon:yes gene_type:complete